MKTELNRSTNENDVRSAIASSGFADAEIQRISGQGAGKNSFQISTSTLNQGQRDKIQQDLQEGSASSRSTTTRSGRPSARRWPRAR